MIKLFIASILLLNFILLLPKDSFSKNKEKANSQRKATEHSNAQLELEDVIYFNDGSSLRGILDTSASKIESNDGTILTYDKTNISSINKEPIYDYKSVIKKHLAPITIQKMGIVELSYQTVPSMTHSIGVSLSYGIKIGRFFYLGLGVGVYNLFQWKPSEPYNISSEDPADPSINIRYKTNYLQLPVFIHLRKVGSKNFVSPYFDYKMGAVPTLETMTIKEDLFETTTKFTSKESWSMYNSLGFGASIKMPYNPLHIVSVGVVFVSYRSYKNAYNATQSVGISMGYSF